MKAPLVSITVPVYNTAEYVEECIQSILSQSYKNIELILVNDGSMDNSAEICRKYEHLSNVLYIEQGNRGPTAARKQGVEAADGEWVMFVDSDGGLYEDAVEHMLSISGGVDIVVCKSLFDQTDSGDGKAVKTSSFDHIGYLTRMYAKDISSSPCAKIFRRNLFNDKSFAFPSHIARWEDWLMNLQLASDNQKDVRITEKKIYKYRNHINSTSKLNILSFDDLQEICQIADRIIGGAVCDKEMKQAKMKNRFTLFTYELPKKDFISDSRHPFVRDIKRCMDEAGVWRPLDRWLLSVSSPGAVKAVWNLRRVARRLEHPTIIISDMKRLVQR